MQIVERLKAVIAAPPAGLCSNSELARLHAFYERMKEAGIAQTREYDLPRPDTIGRSMVQATGRDQSSRRR
jgi:hypothetical protein